MLRGRMQRVPSICSQSRAPGVPPISAHVASSNRSGEFGGHGGIIGPDGHVHGLTTPSKPFVTYDLDIEVEPMEGPEPTPRPAPDWLDFWETGVPPW